MKKNIMIINADREAAQIVKDNLGCPSTNILCMSSMEATPYSSCRVVFVDKFGIRWGIMTEQTER